MDKSRLSLLSLLPLVGLVGCDIAPDEPRLRTSGGVVNKGVLANAVANAYKAGTREWVKRVYTKVDGTFSLDDINFEGVLYIELHTTSQTLATCDAAQGCGDFKNGLKLAGEYDDNLNGVIEFGDKYFYHEKDFVLTAYIKPSQDGTGTFAVTPLTHLAAEKISNLEDVSLDTITLVNAQVAELFGLDGADITRVIPPDITDADAMANADKSQQLYAALNAAVASAATSDSTVADVINTLATSFTENDGLVGNSADPTKVTLASLQTLAQDVAAVVEQELAVDMAQVSAQIQEEITEQESLPADQVVEVSEAPVLEPDFDRDGIPDAEEASQGTDPYNADTDSDGIPDGDEIEHGLNPINPDTDGDGMPDGWEVFFDLLPLTPDNHLDADNDGLNNGEEFMYATHPLVADTDNDGLSDYDELMVYQTNPNSPDSDGDGLSDSEEINDYFTNPNSGDSDSDSMPDPWELFFGFDPNDFADSVIDSDGDGLLNRDEHLVNTNPTSADSDGDGVLDGDEDADGDGISNYVEIMNNLNPVFDDANFDPDADGISNIDEIVNGSDPHVSNPLITFVSDAQIYSNGSSGNVAMTIDESEFYSSPNDLSDKAFVDGIDGSTTVDSNSRPDIMVHSLSGDIYEIPVRDQSDGVTLFSDGWPSLLDASEDGRLLLFASDSANVVASDTNASSDIFILNRGSNTVTRLDMPSEFNNNTYSAKFSEDGSKVVLSTAVTNLEDASVVILDTNATTDVYVYEVATGISRLLSSNGSDSGDRLFRSENMSADGRYVVFRSNASDISFAPDTNGLEDVFVVDLVDNIGWRISQTSIAGNDVTNGSHSPVISANGKGTIYFTRKDIFNLGAVPSFDQIYYFDSGTTGIHLVTQSWDGSNNNFADGWSDTLSVRLSADGRYVMYKSSATNLVTNDGNGSVDDLFIWDRTDQSTRIISQYGYGDANSDGVLEFDDNPGSNHTSGMGIMGQMFAPDGSAVYAMLSYGDEYSDLAEPNCIGPGNTCLYKINLHTLQADSDGDGLNDRQELALTTNPNNPDTDGDGLLDSVEINIRTSALNPDTDNDGLTDNQEQGFGTNPVNPDTDGDGIDDGDEINTTNTDPLLSDTDGDGVNDGQEIIDGTNPLDPTDFAV